MTQGTGVVDAKWWVSGAIVENNGGDAPEGSKHRSWRGGRGFRVLPLGSSSGHWGIAFCKVQSSWAWGCGGPCQAGRQDSSASPSDTLLCAVAYILPHLHVQTHDQLSKTSKGQGTKVRLCCGFGPRCLSLLSHVVTTPWCGHHDPMHALWLSERHPGVLTLPPASQGKLQHTTTDQWEGGGVDGQNIT